MRSTRSCSGAGTSQISASWAEPCWHSSAPLLLRWLRAASCRRPSTPSLRGGRVDPLVKSLCS